MKTFLTALVLASTLTAIAASPATTITGSGTSATHGTSTIITSSGILTTITVAGSGTSTSTASPVALYTNTCGGSSLCSAAISDDCHNAILSVSPGIAYTDQAQFNAGHCSLTYETDGAGAEPLSGQIIIDTANQILDDCQPCGSYGTNNAGLEHADPQSQTCSHHATAPLRSPRGYHSSSQNQDQDPDTHIRETDNDAALARLSAVQKQYVADPFIAALVPRAHLQKPRPPLINIGTYLRGTAIDELVDQWIRLASAESLGNGNGNGKVQIVSLGAGSDTRFWRLATGPHKDLLVRYVELDFPEITSRKAMAIRKSKVLNPLLGPSESVKIGNGGTSLHSPVYNLIPVDLRKPPSESLAPLLAGSSDPLLLPNVQTLLLFECVLAYMSPEASDAVIQWFAEYALQDGAGSVGSIVYEMFGLGDAFGRVMLSNLKSRNVSLPGVEPYTDKASLPQRFLRLNFTAADALTLHEIRRAYVAPEELERISTLEFLDELEELDLVLDHYAITWGSKAPSGKAQDHWKTWGLTRKAKKPEEE
ncbi:hypothetical protein EVG20_g8426 [Dentipellis fragilis]|uniref:Leucine carboxyl methyltransferase 1 n=1 Tax=Dentipellis fragilis TaxID=205917 RepID=A0A4Y9Y6P2_9AGAM|nr:hypothetical protein EVG20_g8426 [Dentipellis fragilis]